SGTGNFTIQDAAGPVVLDKVLIGSPQYDWLYSNPRLIIARCPNLHLLNCTVLGDFYAPEHVSILDSGVEMTRCALTGSQGRPALRSLLAGIPAQSGSPALRSSGSRVILVDCNVLGGLGGDNKLGAIVTTPAGAGGSAIVAVGSTLHVYGASTA